MVFHRNKSKTIVFYTLYEIIARKTDEAVLPSKKGRSGNVVVSPAPASAAFQPRVSPKEEKGMGGRMLLMPCRGAMWKVSDGKPVGSKESLWIECVSQQRRCWVSLKMSGQNMQAKVHIHRRENAGQRVDK